MSDPSRREEPTLDSILHSLKQGGGAPKVRMSPDSLPTPSARTAPADRATGVVASADPLDLEPLPRSISSRLEAASGNKPSLETAIEFDMSDVVLAGGMAFAAFLSEGLSGETVVAFAEQQGWDADAVYPGTLREVLALPAPAGYPRILLVDLDGVSEAVAGLAALRSLCPESQVLAVGSANDIQLYRDLQAVGVADYLVKPLAPPSLLQSMTRIESERSLKQTSLGKKAKVITVIGAGGGVGASTLAVNLAWGLSQQREDKTALLDLDLHFGVASLALDLDPGRGLREILAAPERLDSLLVGSAAVMAGERLAVWSAEDPLDSKMSYEGAGAVALVEELARNFGEVVVDMPRHQVPQHRQLLDHTDEVLLVSDLSLAGVRDCTRLLAFLRQEGRDLPVKLVLGRCSKERPGQVDRTTFERAVKEKVSWVVPEDAKAAAAAANAGKPVKDVAAKSPLSLAIEDIVRAFDAPGASGARRGLDRLAFWRRKS
tara:strand:- start:3380 stop:4849 length:1470 start_codon:yes stop_codon:yes gene_type:complete